jgi:hypothetical protein
VNWSTPRTEVPCHLRGAALVMVERTASTGEEPLVFLASGDDEEEEEEEEEEELPNLRFLMEETRNDIFFGWGGGTGLQIKIKSGIKDSIS